jgi:uncharacterized delta-60 repeat protein
MRGVRLRRVAGIICVAIVASGVATALASGGAGSLDRSFGDRGKVLTRFKHRKGRQSFGHHNLVPRANAVLVDSKNRAVAIGTADGKFALGRYKPSGSLDPSFSGNGKVTTQVSANHKRDERLSRAYAGAIDSHGRILAAGVAFGNLFGERIGLARYKPNGHLDKSFGTGGEVRTLIGSKYGGVVARAVAIDSKGRIVVAGSQGGPGQFFALARYKPNGNLDRSFGENGTLRTSFNGYDGAESVAIDSQGRIVAAGFAKRDLALARYEPDGSLDPSFGGDGEVTTDFAGRAAANSIAIDSQGRIVATVDSREPDKVRRFTVARYSEDGSLDGSFGNGGVVTTDFPDHSVAQDVAIDKSGRIVVAGRASSPGHRKFALARYLPDGELDPAFSHDGKTITTFGSGKEVQAANGVAVDRTGRIVAVGYARGKFALARYLGR